MVQDSIIHETLRKDTEISVELNEHRAEQSNERALGCSRDRNESGDNDCDNSTGSCNGYNYEKPFHQ